MAGPAWPPPIPGEDTSGPQRGGIGLPRLYHPTVPGTPDTEGGVQIADHAEPQSGQGKAPGDGGHLATPQRLTSASRSGPTQSHHPGLVRLLSNGSVFQGLRTTGLLDVRPPGSLRQPQAPSPTEGLEEG